MTRLVQSFVIAVTICLLTTPRAPPSAADAFSPLLQQSIQQRQQRQQPRIHPLHDANDSFLDVEFEKVKPKESSNDEASSSAVTDLRNDPLSPSLTSSAAAEKSLLELSLDMDPQWKEARIPFSFDDCYIDCNVAFTVDLDGTTFGIGVPCDAAVAIVLEEKGKVTYINPAEEQHEELVEIMATQLQELLGDDVYLRNTPKILTVCGNLGQYTDNWQDNLFNDTVSTEELMDDSDEGLDFFYDFMKSELGQEEFQKTLDECRQENESETIDSEILDLFNVPGLGDQQDDIAGLEKMLEEMANSEISDSESFTKLGQDLEHDGVALKLIGFNFRNGKSYSLVKLLKPFTIVGKYADNGEKGDLRFDLLTPEEEKLVVPRLEQICEEDLEQSGLSLQ